MYRHAHGKGKDFPHLEAYGLIVDGKESGTAKTKAAKKAARKEKQVAQAKRSIGKRQKALKDKILKINMSAGQLCDIRTRPVHVASRTAIYGFSTISDKATALR